MTAHVPSATEESQDDMQPWEIALAMTEDMEKALAKPCKCGEWDSDLGGCPQCDLITSARNRAERRIKALLAPRSESAAKGPGFCSTHGGYGFTSDCFACKGLLAAPLSAIAAKGETPRTDAGLLWLPIERGGKLTTMAVVDMEFARQLERELDGLATMYRAACRMAEEATPAPSSSNAAKEEPRRRDIGFDDWMSFQPYSVKFESKGCDAEIFYTAEQMRAAWVAGSLENAPSTPSATAAMELPPELYDGMAVYVEAVKIGNELQPKHVSNVLDALVRLIRKRQRSAMDRTSEGT